MNVKKALTATITLGALALTLAACGHQSKLDTEKQLGPAEIMNQPEKTIWYQAFDSSSITPTTSTHISTVIVAKDGKMTLYDAGKNHLTLKDVANKSDKEIENIVKKDPHETRKPDFKLVMDGSGNNVTAEMLNNINDKEGTIYPGSYTSMKNVQEYTMNGQKILKATFSGLTKTNGSSSSRGADFLITKLPKPTQEIIYDKPGTKNTDKYEVK